jgi:hypothetical protein
MTDDIKAKVTDTVKRLRAIKHPNGTITAEKDEPDGPWVYKTVYETDPDCEAVADLLEALAARLAELEEALRVVPQDEYTREFARELGASLQGKSHD